MSYDRRRTDKGNPPAKPKDSIYARIGVDMYERLVREAEAQFTTKASIVRRALDYYLEYVA